MNIENPVPANRDMSFAKRLAIAIERNVHAPSGHGRQRWLLREMKKRADIVISPEAIRKWISGDARPRPSVMTQIAMVLDCDEAWLSLGIQPAATPREKKKQNAMTSGAVNLVAGQIQLAGGNIAFPEDEEPDCDFYAIVNGRQHAVTVKLADETNEFKLSVFPTAKTIVVVIPTKMPTVYEFVSVPSDLVQSASTKRGGYCEFEIERTKGGDFKIGETRLPYTDFSKDL